MDRRVGRHNPTLLGDLTDWIREAGSIDQVLDLEEARMLVDQTERLLTVHEVSVLVDRSHYTVYRWIWTGRIQAVQLPVLGGPAHWFIPENQLSTIVRPRPYRKRAPV